MDWKTFIATLVDSIAWPVVVAFVTFMLKEKISGLLPRLKRLKHKETEIEFTEIVTELVKEKNEFESEHFSSDDLPSNEDFIYLNRLSYISPRIAVMEAFRVVELAAEKAILKAHPNANLHELRHPLRARKLLVDKNILTLDQYEQLRELRNLRNTAAHSHDFSLTGMPIQSYIDIALTIATWLNKYEQEKISEDR